MRNRNDGTRLAEIQRRLREEIKNAGLDAPHMYHAGIQDIVEVCGDGGEL